MVTPRIIKIFCMVVALTAFGLGFGPGSIVYAETIASVSEKDVQVLASGPIHEAFAAAVVLNPEPGIVAAKALPALIEEIPPKQKPEGDVQWIPGYWAWDDEINEYIWVSGVWRLPPPGRQWIPGYWTRAKQGYQWISGYWTSVEAKETEYLPEPPESVEVGPSSNSPSADYTWIPGCWIWNYGRYAWRPGYWAVVHPNWIWVPVHNIFTPRGYISVGGYWDYTVMRRGVLFAPVFFPRGHLGLTFSFSPGFMIDLNIFNDALFMRPRYRHYYYGNYYAPKHYKRGIYPWFSLHSRRAVYDPIYAHQRWNHRKDRKWENRLQTRFRERRENKRLQSPRSVDLRIGADKAGRSLRPARLDSARKTKFSAYRFQPLSKKERREFSKREKEVRTYQKQRQSRETQRQNMLEEKASKRQRPNKEKFYRSPIMDRSNKKATRKKALPALHKAPKTNPNVEPLQREYGLSRSRYKSQKSKNRAQKSEVWEQRSMDNDQKSINRGRRSGVHMRKSNDRQQRESGVRQIWDER